VTLNQAAILLQAAQSKAAEMGVAVSIAVLDAGGNLQAFCRMDGAWLGSIDIALKKAKTAVLFEVETQAMWAFCNSTGPAHGMESTNDGLVTFGGGIPLKEENGRLSGSIGVSGGQVAEDYEIARAAVAAAGPTINA
jgi:uncharacterized protein GlcG (DUF336 family)